MRSCHTAALTVAMLDGMNWSGLIVSKTLFSCMEDKALTYMCIFFHLGCGGGLDGQFQLNELTMVYALHYAPLCLICSAPLCYALLLLVLAMPQYLSIFDWPSYESTTTGSGLPASHQPLPLVPICFQAGYISSGFVNSIKYHHIKRQPQPGAKRGEQFWCCIALSYA
jgi:hypothetical protein